MPIANPKPCRHPGCRLMASSAGYCDPHRAAQWAEVETRTNSTPALREARRIRSSSQWRKCERVFAARHPLCCDPFEQHGSTSPTLGTQSHHVEGLAKRPDLAFVEGNLRRLCDYCHARVEFMVRNGKDALALFAIETARTDAAAGLHGDETRNDASPSHAHAAPQNAQAPGGWSKVGGIDPTTLTVAASHNSQGFGPGRG